VACSRVPDHVRMIARRRSWTRVRQDVPGFSGIIVTCRKDGKIFLDDKLRTADIGISISRFMLT
jgi:hypothetical protein